MDAAEFQQIQNRIQDSLRNLASSSSRVDDAALALLKNLPGYNPEQPKQSADAARQINLSGSIRALCLDLVIEAQQRGQAPMQYAARNAAEPLLQRLLSATLLLCQQELLEPVSILVALEDVVEACSLDHCPDIISWVEAKKPVLAAPPFSNNFTAVNQMTRLCNSILKRLGKHEVVSKARLLMLSASVTPLTDRSGLGVLGTFAEPDPPVVEAVPEGALDSTGKPVDTLVFSTFWSLQKLLQEPQALLASADSWSTFKKHLTLVLGELSKCPATVPAVRPAPADAEAAGSAACTAAADGGSSKLEEEGAGSQCYLSSWKLFGLQLTDSGFRRDFLVQVLVVLRTLLIQGKVPTATLKVNQRMEALALEKEVYKVLEASPRNGKEFCRAVREVFERETTWVGWKRGGKDFVVPGKEAEPPGSAATAPGAKPAANTAAAAAAAARKQPPGPTSCIDWSQPPLTPPLAEAVGKAKVEAEARRVAQQKRYTEGIQLKQEVDLAGRQYDNNGEPPEAPAPKRARYTRLLDNGSNLTLWAQARQADRHLQSHPLLNGLKVQDQQQYPTPEAVCAQAIRELLPESGIERDYRRLAEDALYRWRIGRLVTHTHPDTENADNAHALELAMLDLLPDKLPEEVKKQFEEERAAKKVTPKGKLAARRTPPPAVGAAGRKDEPGAQAENASAAAGNEAAGRKPDDAAPVGAAAGTAAGAVLSGGPGEEVGKELDATGAKDGARGASPEAATATTAAAAAGSTQEPVEPEEAEEGEAGEADAAAEPEAPVVADQEGDKEEEGKTAGEGVVQHSTAAAAPQTTKTGSDEQQQVEDAAAGDGDDDEEGLAGLVEEAEQEQQPPGAGQGAAG